MFLSIDKELAQPVYMQIRDKIVEMIRNGLLSAGDKLPGTRELATQLGVSRKTVLQAYLELAADSWVESKPGSCTYVLDRDAFTGQSNVGRRDFQSEGRRGDLEILPGQPDHEVSQMDWGDYSIPAAWFRMPAHYQNWQGSEEWISFSRAIPDAKLFPFERIKKVSSQMLWDPQAYFFDYGNPQGYLPLCEYIEMQQARDGLNVADGRNDFVVCSGFQSALNLLLTILLKPGDMVVVENPTFNAIINLLEARGIPHRGIPMEHDGMDIDYLERLVEKEKPRLLITIPTMHNPTGVTMSREKRQRLMAIAQKHNMPVIEDNWAMLLGYEGEHQPSLKSMDGGGNVIQIGSFSKAFLPGSRVAWVVIPSDLAMTFIIAKRSMDRSDSYFLQTLVHEFIKKGYMDLHCRKVDRIYKARRELMDEVMRQHFPAEVSWKRPRGGFSYWVALPPGYSSKDLLREAVQSGMDFAPGNYFHVGREDSGNFRLSFSTLNQSQIRQGVRRLGTVIRRVLADSANQKSNRSAS